MGKWFSIFLCMFAVIFVGCSHQSPKRDVAHSTHQGHLDTLDTEWTFKTSNLGLEINSVDKSLVLVYFPHKYDVSPSNKVSGRGVRWYRAADACQEISEKMRVKYQLPDPQELVDLIYRFGLGKAMWDLDLEKSKVYPTLESIIFPMYTSVPPYRLQSAAHYQVLIYNYEAATDRYEFTVQTEIDSNYIKTTKQAYALCVRKP